MSIRTRLFLGMSLLSALVVGLALAATVQVAQISRLAEEITTRSMQRVVYVSQVNTNLVQWRGLNLSIILSDNPSAQQEYQNELSRLISDTGPLIQQYGQIMDDPVRRADYEAFFAHITWYLGLSNELELLADQGRLEAARARFAESQRQFDATLFHIDRIRREEMESARQASARATASVGQTRFLFITVTLSLVALQLGLTLIFWRSFSSGLRRLLAATRRIASGDLTRPVEVKGRHELAELARSFNAMMASLKRSHEENVRLTQEALKLQEERINILRSQFSRVVQAQEEERKRISRDLHDDTLQALVGLSRRFDGLISRDKKLPRSLRAELAEMWQVTDQTIQGVRGFSQSLRPSIIDDLGLVPAAEWLAERLNAQQHINAQVQIEGPAHRLAPETELALFRIVQEALNNVLKHSGAQEVRIHIRFQETHLSISVSDDGKGFAVPASLGDMATQGRLGLLGMKERADLLGGKLHIASQPGQGTTVTVEVPLTETGTPPRP